jgi:hypothetical protein
MNVLLDLVGSSIIGGIILLAIFSYNTRLNDASLSQTTNNIVQSNLNAVTSILDYDFKKIGFGVNDSVKILNADTSGITFLSDINNDGQIKIISYSLSSIDALVATPNPRDRLLYRTIDGSPLLTSNMGVTRFRLYYYDDEGNITSSRSEIKYFKVKITCESIYPIEENYYVSACWNKTINPRNL